MEFFSKSRIAFKILAMMIFSNVLIGFGVGGLVIYNLSRQNAHSLDSYKRSITKLYKSRLRQLVDASWGTLSHYQKLVESGKLTTEEAKKRAYSIIASVRYNNNRGYFWLNDTNLPVPTMVMHPIFPSLNGRILNDVKYNCASGDLKKNLFTAAVEVCNQSGTGFVDYVWPDPNNKNVTLPKLSCVRLFKPWNIIIGSGAYIDEINKMVSSRSRDYSSEITQRIWETIFITFVLIVIFGFKNYFMAKMISKPIQHTVDIVSIIAKGDLETAGKMTNTLCEKKYGNSGDETGELIASIKKMVKHLTSLVGQVQHSGIQVTSSATEIAASARELEATVAEQAASTNQVGAAARQISATSQELVSTMGKVATVANYAGDLATQGQNGLKGMHQTMQNLLKSTSAISSRLSAIKERADDINSVVTTITKVADQTNLLSLNAAIEAEKAGEYGMGFAVVAREIRRLADQTAVATLDIEEMVKEMHSGVALGITEMGSFSKEMVHGVTEVKAISSQLEQIITHVQDLTPQIEEVDQGVQQQAEGANQISDSIHQLSDGAHQAAENLQEFNKTAALLNRAAMALQTEISNFKIESGS